MSTPRSLEPHDRFQAEDEALHAKFHKEHAHAVAFPGWKNETVVRSFLAEGARIVRVSAEQSQGTYKKKIADLHAFVNRELAYSELPADAEAAANRRITYLYVVNKKVQGCLIAEPIDRAFPVLNARRAAGDSQPDEAAGSPKKKLSRPESPLRCSTTSQPAQLGVSRYAPFVCMWCCARAQRVCLSHHTQYLGGQRATA